MSLHNRVKARIYRDHEVFEKKEVLFISKRLLQIDLTIMGAFLMKEMDSTEIAPTSILEHSFYTSGFPQVLLAHLHFYS